MPFPKPPAGAKPDFGHPHAYRLRHAILLNERSGRIVTDSVTGMRGAITTALAWSSKLHGSSLSFPGAVAGVGAFDGAQFGCGNGALSGLGGAHVLQGWIGVPFSVIAGVMQTGSQAGFQSVWSNNSAGLYLVGGTVQWYNRTASTQVLTPNVPYIISAASGCEDATGATDLVINGRLDKTTATGTATGMDGTSRLGGDGGSPFIGEISFIYVYSRYIPPTEMARIHADPFAMFAEARVFALGSGGAPAPITGTGDATISAPVIDGSGSSGVGGAGGDVTIGGPAIGGSGGSGVSGAGGVTIGGPAIAGSGDFVPQPDARVTDVKAEVFGTGAVEAHVTDVKAEVFGEGAVEAAVTQTVLEVWGDPRIPLPIPPPYGEVAVSEEPNAGTSLCGASTPLLFCEVQLDAVGEPLVTPSAWFSWVDQPLNDATSQKEPRILNISTLKRELSDWTGRYSVAHGTVTLWDADRAIRSMAIANTLVRKQISFFLIDDVNRRAGGIDPLRIGQYLISDYELLGNMTVKLAFEARLGGESADATLQKLVPYRTLDVLDFPNLPKNLVGKRARLPYGILSDEAAVLTTPLPLPRDASLPIADRPDQIGVGGGTLVERHGYITCTKNGKEGPLSAEGGNVLPWTTSGCAFVWDKVADPDVDGYRLYVFDDPAWNPFTGAGHATHARLLIHDNVTIDGGAYGKDFAVIVMDWTDGTDYLTVPTSQGGGLGTVPITYVGPRLMADGQIWYEGMIAGCATWGPVSFFGSNGYDLFVISAYTSANPVVVSTYLPHGFTTGLKVSIALSNPKAPGAGDYEVTVVSPTSFSVDYDTSAEPAQVGGDIGVVTRTMTIARERVPIAKYATDLVFGDVVQCPRWMSVTGTFLKYVVLNNRRWTMCYLRPGSGVGEAFRSGAVPLLCNLGGIEETGDGTGRVITSKPRQDLHFENNFVAQNHNEDADWYPIPMTGTSPAYSVFASQSFEEVKDASEVRVSPDGYDGGFIIGNDGEPTPIGDWIQRCCLGGDYNRGTDRHGREIASIEDPAKAPVKAFTIYQTFLDSYSEKKDRSKLANVVSCWTLKNYVPPLNTTTPLIVEPAESRLWPSLGASAASTQTPQGQTDWLTPLVDDRDDDSIRDLGGAPTGERAFHFEDWTSRDFSLAVPKSVLAYQKARRKDGPDLHTLTTDLCGFDVDVGDNYTTEHFAGKRSTVRLLRCLSVELAPPDPFTKRFGVTLVGHDLTDL